MLGRTLALDVGDVRIGVAMSDPLGIIASPHSVITCSNAEADMAAVLQLIADHEVKRVIIGLPLNKSGERGPQAEKTIEFAERLKAVCPLEIIYQDERFTSASAERILIGADMRRKDRKKVIDKIAAQQILQTWMDRADRAKKA